LLGRRERRQRLDRSHHRRERAAPAAIAPFLAEQLEGSLDRLVVEGRGWMALGSRSSHTESVPKPGRCARLERYLAWRKTQMPNAPGPTCVAMIGPYWLT
jgi:hypothetical protein